MSNIWQLPSIKPTPANKGFAQIYFSSPAIKCDHHNCHLTFNINPLHKAEYRGRPTPLSSSPLAHTPPHYHSLQDQLRPPLALIEYTTYIHDIDQI